MYMTFAHGSNKKNKLIIQLGCDHNVLWCRFQQKSIYHFLD